MKGKRFSSEIMTGFFDVRQYKANVAKKDQKVLGEDERIVFNVTFKPEDLPAMFADHAGYYTNREGVEMKKVSFKISGVGSNVKWFNGHGEQIDKPQNAELDGKRYKSIIDGVQLDADPDSKEPRGYWVNSIQIEEVREMDFGGRTICGSMNPITGEPIEDI